MFHDPFHLGNLQVPNRVLLAPLAGVSDSPFRRICTEHGAGLTYIEMLSAAGMRHNTKKTRELLYRDHSENILGAQITGPKPEIVAEGSEILEKLDLPIETLDLNMGCPVKKIVSKGSGSAIVRDPDNAGAIARAVRDAVSVPVTAKIRVGYNEQEITVSEVCTALAEAEMAMLIIHGRVRSDTYSDPIRYGHIREGFDAARAASGETPFLVGNGNIFDRESAQRMADETGCEGLLISRGALGNPWLFDQILNDHDRQPTLAEWREVVLRHACYHADFYGGDTYGAIRFRKHLLWYISGFPGSRAMRQKMSTVGSMAEVREAMDAYCATIPNDFVRFDSNRLSGWTPDSAYDPKYEMDRTHDRGVEKDSEEDAAEGECGA